MSTHAWPTTLLPLYTPEGSPRGLSPLVLAAHYSGLLPHLREDFLNGTLGRAVAVEALPAPFEVIASDGETVVCRAEHWMALVRTGDTDSVHMMVASDNEALVDAVFDALKAALIAIEPAPTDDIDMFFWTNVSYSPKRRRLHAPKWASIRENYGAGVQPVLDTLMTLRQLPVSGRLLILSGPPGTGKTTLIKALARQYEGFCRAEVVLDAERLFGDANYMMSLLSSEHDKGRLLIAEDVSELISVEARNASGQGLSRLLSLSDGLIGEGSGLLLLLTTNEPIASLHPAVVRPGRCLANITIPALTSLEGSEWIGHTISDRPDGITLAELYALRGAIPKVATSPQHEPRRHGVYL